MCSIRSFLFTLYNKDIIIMVFFFKFIVILNKVSNYQTIFKDKHLSINKQGEIVFREYTMIVSFFFSNLYCNVNLNISCITRDIRRW
jgi:hypothetical protein